MLERITSVWGRLADSFWLVPALVASVYIALALGSIEIDRSSESSRIGIAFQGDAGAARDILATIAGSLITVAGLAFSLTIIVLTLVSSQFSPHAVRAMLADRVNQLIAGSFVGIFAYCLIVLRTVRDETSAHPEFVPALSVSLAIALALLSLALLLVFIHHAGTSIQATHIAARIARTTLDAVDRLYPEHLGQPADDASETPYPEWLRSDDGAEVLPPRPGYVQLLVLDDVAEAVAGTSAKVEVAVCAGDFVTEQTPILYVWPAGAVDEEREQALRRAVVVGKQRDLRQDAAYGVRQLADIALRALSPGMNDPTTATTCISYLGAVLERLASRSFPTVLRRYEHEGVLLHVRRRRFDDYLREAFSEIARYAADNPRVAVAALAALVRVAEAARRARAVERHAAVFEMGRVVAATALGKARTDDDRAEVLQGLETLERVTFEPVVPTPTT